MIDNKLLTFITVAKVKNLTKSSELLNITQPAVSQHIKALENYYNKKLLYKNGKTMELTAEGEILLQYAEELNKISKKAFNEITNSSYKKRFKIGATLTLGGYVLPQLIGFYKPSHENIEIFLEVNNTINILNSLIRGELDLAIVEGPFNKNRFKYTKLKDDELILVFSPEHYFFDKSTVTIDEVLNGNLILREEGSGTRKVLENSLFEKGYSIASEDIYMEIGDINATISLVKSNVGYTIISKEAVKEDLNNHTLYTLPIKDMKILREFNFVYANNSPLDFITDFVLFCKNNIYK
ncbi:LysR family transcriptional regulator [Oceanirhabdus seepicola]|uniref:LysR family transcriptional regulator n=1 Tax=Oceanirhabdus seepicola TaxID=2828781 RepID=A0A9J6NZP0_9CLOT|nr:LysR family transcriptional regulator [Oceanirhabdus seepicola]MCM1989430.1 LysR family transcriptional regulator [Oceanirhabdus seepicola]